jgi:hypothetical protein
VTAGRIFKGQLNGQPGEEGLLSFEKFPNVGLVKVRERGWTLGWLESLHVALKPFIPQPLLSAPQERGKLDLERIGPSSLSLTRVRSGRVKAIWRDPIESWDV